MTDGMDGLTVVTGSNGSGKTRLLFDMQERDEGDATVVFGAYASLHDRPVECDDPDLQAAIRLLDDVIPRAGDGSGVRVMRFTRNLLARSSDGDRHLLFDCVDGMLHPEWQCVWAHALVCAAHSPRLRVTIATMSPYTVKACAAYAAILDTPATWVETVRGEEPHTIPAEELGRVYDTLAEPLRAVDRDVFAYIASGPAVAS